MDFYYKNETLYVDITNDINLDTISILQKRLFRIIDDYGIDKIIISLFGYNDKELLNLFKKAYYQRYKGYMLIKM